MAARSHSKGRCKSTQSETSELGKGHTATLDTSQDHSEHGIHAYALLFIDTFMITPYMDIRSLVNRNAAVANHQSPKDRSHPSLSYRAYKSKGIGM